MKKIVKRILITVGIIIGIIVLLIAVLMLKVRSETRKLTPVNSQEIVNGIITIRDGYSNMYLIKDMDYYIAVDAGNKMNITKSEFEKMQIDPHLVKTILLTHTDADHVGALELFSNADIYISEQEEQLINGETSRFLFIGNTIGDREYSLIKDGEEFYIGNVKIQGVLTPGHTPGSMCYLINDKYLFTGDVLGLKNEKVVRFNEFFNMDTETAVNSMIELKKFTQVEYIFTAHHGFTKNLGKAFSEYN